LTKDEILDKLQLLNREQELQWMINLGAQFTIAARSGYPIQEKPGNIQHLVAFNEMQHQVYSRIRHLQRGEEWTIESFVNGLLEKSTIYKVQTDFNWALSRSLLEIH
jgi:hypothetical protein